jgi:hypothetical protein
MFLVTKSQEQPKHGKLGQWLKKGEVTHERGRVKEGGPEAFLNLLNDYKKGLR